MGWKRTSVMEERLRFVVLANAGNRSIKDLCEEFGISRQTGYVWLRRYQAEGQAALRDRSRRPLSSPRKSPPEAEQAVVELREKWPDWGAPKLARLLGQNKPSLAITVRTVHRILSRRGLIAPEDRHRQAVKRFQREAPNEMWQMDFKGPAPKGGDFVGPLSMLDDHSRYLLELRRLGNTQAEGVRSRLTATFQSVGMPDSMLLDHGTPWWNAASPWGLTELSVWIMQLGIRLIYSGIRHPQTQGKVERMHQSLKIAVKKRHGNLEDQNWLDAFREEYNNIRPHEAIGMATPASRWQPSTNYPPEKLREWEYDPSAECAQLGCDGQLGWHGRRWEISNALRRQVVGIERIDDRAIVYFCRTPIRELNLRTGEAIPILGAPIRRFGSEEERLNQPTS